MLLSLPGKLLHHSGWSDDGIVLVDAGFGPVAPKLEAALKTISDKKVKYLVNTHWHGDHTGGDVYFGKTATIIAQDNVGKRMEKGRRSRTHESRESAPGKIWTIARCRASGYHVQ